MRNRKPSTYDPLIERDETESNIIEFDRYLTIRQVMRITSLSRSTIYRTKELRRVKLTDSGSRVGISERAVFAWLRQREALMP